MKVGGACQVSNIGKSSGSRDLFLKETVFYDTMFIKVYELPDEDILWVDYSYE